MICFFFFHLSQSVDGEAAFGQRLPTQTTSTPYPHSTNYTAHTDRVTERVTERVTSRPNTDTALGLPGSLHGSSASTSYHSQQTTLSSGISSIRGDGQNDGPTPVPQSFMPRLVLLVVVAGVS